MDKVQRLSLVALVSICLSMFGNYMTLPSAAASKSKASPAEVDSTNLISGKKWTLQNDCNGDLLDSRAGATDVEVSVQGQSEGTKPLLLVHEIKTDGADDQPRAFHIHLQTKANCITSLLIEVLSPKYPYPHALYETRTLKPEWQTFDFDCITAAKGADSRSLVLKVQRVDKAAKANFKGVMVTIVPLSRLGIDENDVTESGIEKNIEKNRKADLVVRVLNADGKAVAGKTLQIIPVREKFLFGTEVQGLKSFDDSPLQKSYQQALVSVFNFGTVTPYWPQVEPTRGHINYQPFDDQIKWLQEHKLIVKLTPAFWPHWAPKYVPEDPAAARKLVDENLRSFIKHFAPMKVDVIENNEVAAALTDTSKNGIINLVRSEGAVKVLKEVTAIERAGLQDSRPVQLIYNDYEHGQTEFDMLDELKRTGALPDSIGLQLHMTQGEWPLVRILYILKRLSKYERPIYVTEISIISGEYKLAPPGGVLHDWISTADGEKRQAEYVEKLYKFLFSRCEVFGITWWDLSDKDAWEGAPRGLLRADMSPKPAFIRLEKLVHDDWRTKAELVSDDHGYCKIRAFKGAYRIFEKGTENNAPDSSVLSVELESSSTPTTISLTCRGVSK